MGYLVLRKTKQTYLGYNPLPVERLRFGYVPQKNANTGQTLLHWAIAITSELLLLFSLYLVNVCDTKSAPSPPALTYPMKASDFHLPAP